MNGFGRGIEPKELGTNVLESSPQKKGFCTNILPTLSIRTNKMETFLNVAMMSLDPQGHKGAAVVLGAGYDSRTMFPSLPGSLTLTGTLSTPTEGQSH